MTIQSKKIIACDSNRNCFETTLPIHGDNALLTTLVKHKVNITPSQPSNSIIKAWWQILLIYIGVIIFLFLLLIKIINFINGYDLL